MNIDIEDDFQGIAWLDVESTGLSPFLASDKLLQVACFVTDTDLNLLDEKGLEMVVQYSEEEVKELYDNSIPFVQDMHNKTGLWDRLSTEGKPLEEIDTALLNYVSQVYPNKRTVWMGGNSIKLDRDFTSAFLPKFSDFLHYRNVDVTSFAGPARKWYGVMFEKKKTHDAREDILESLEELRFLRKTIFR